MIEIKNIIGNLLLKQIKIYILHLIVFNKNLIKY